MIHSAKFIEFPAPFDPTERAFDPAPIFKKSFTIEKVPEKAELIAVALGLGYVYLNGEPITKDVFNTPCGNYLKTLWYHTYEVSRLLREGENELCVIVGNGWYNEFLETPWNFHNAEWRGAPKLALALDMDGERLYSDESWVVSREASPVVFNQLRSGETYDCRIGEKFRLFGTDGYLPVKISEDYPKGVFRPCHSQPIREFERYTPVATFKNAKGNIIYDFGQNLSGYLELTLQGKRDEVVTLRHAERVFDDGTLDHRGMDDFPFHHLHDFQTNRIILSGGVDSPLVRFTYHGFRFVEIEGECEIIKIKSVFVHQAVDKISDFKCSNELLNKISRCGDFSVWSNMFYMLTDCPTREKLGWTNDALASAEQILMNFDSLPFFEKWLQDLFDEEREDGNLPSIVPNGAWNVMSCTGPLCTGFVFKFPWRLYEASGNADYVKAAYPLMCRHLDWMYAKRDSDGLIGYGLGDWNGGDDEKFRFNPTKFVDTALIIEFADLTVKSAELSGEKNERAQEIYDSLYNRFFEVFYDSRADRSIINTQTAVAMMIYNKKGGATEGLAAQLRQAVAYCDNHHECGMVGLQYLVPVLDDIGASDLMYKILTAKGYPSYSLWMEDGATTLYEMWNTKKSANHHMNSSAVAWFMKKLVGLSRTKDTFGYNDLTLCPYFPEDMTFCEGNFRGIAQAKWERRGDKIHYILTFDKDVSVRLRSPEGYSVEGEMHEGEFSLVFTKSDD